MLDTKYTSLTSYKTGLIVRMLVNNGMLLTWFGRAFLEIYCGPLS